MVVVDRWSLFGGGRLLRFDCIFIFHPFIYFRMLQIRNELKPVKNVVTEMKQRIIVTSFTIEMGYLKSEKEREFFSFA